MKINSDKNTNDHTSRKRKIIFSILLIIIVIVVTIAVGELLIRVFRPQQYMYPRWEFSAKYGSVLFGNCKMVETYPGRWKFTYTINDYQYRGRLIHVSNAYDKENIVILGDSYSFGSGVNDGDEYPALIANKLKNYYDVINLSVGGWGLTQQIRRYYEFGQLYSPKIVLLQFCVNDPSDNFRNMVTTVENGRFKFRNSNKILVRKLAQKYLSKSIIQKSQLYNIIKKTAYDLVKGTAEKKGKLSYVQTQSHEKTISPEEQFYNELLELFAKDMNQKGIYLVMISVNGDLDKFPDIKSKVSDLSSTGLVDYYEVMPWFENVTDYSSPEGHLWGKKAHYILGEMLSKIIKTYY